MASIIRRPLARQPTRATHLAAAATSTTPRHALTRTSPPMAAAPRVAFPAAPATYRARPLPLGRFLPPEHHPATASGAARRPRVGFASVVARASGRPALGGSGSGGGGAMEEGSASAAGAAVVRRLMAAKAESGKSFSELSAETGLTNVYVAQLLRRQAQLKPDMAPKLRAALPALTDDLVDLMMQPPFRSYHPDIVHEPAIYRLNEAVMHFGESIKEIINEEFGDGIMSAIDFYCSVDKVQGADGKDRVVVTFDGKYLPYSEQKSEHMMSRPTRKTS